MKVDMWKSGNGYALACLCRWLGHARILIFARGRRPYMQRICTVYDVHRRHAGIGCLIGGKLGDSWFCAAEELLVGLLVSFIFEW